MAFVFTFRGKEYINYLDYNQYDFHSRSYDPYIGRFNQIDGANQFASGYVGMGNNPVSGIDPDGQWVHIVIGAAIGGVANLGYKAFTGQIHSWKDGFAAFGIGAVAGGVGAATGGAAFAAAGGGAAGAGGFLAGAAGGAAGAAVSSPIQGLGNAAYFGDPYSIKSFGRDIAFGALGGGIVNGAIAGFNKTPNGSFRNVWNGDMVADGASRFGLRNSSLLKQQGWTKGVGGRWYNAFGGDLTFSGVEQYGTGSLAGNKIGDVVGRGGNLSNIGINDIDNFYLSVNQTWGNQGLTNIGRALQKHSGRIGSPFENLKFSHQTANQDGLNILGNILNSQNQIIRPAPQGGFEIFDKLTKHGFAVSRNGLFNGFRDLK